MKLVFVVNSSVILNDLETVVMIVWRLKANWIYFCCFTRFSLGCRWIHVPWIHTYPTTRLQVAV